MRLSLTLMCFLGLVSKSGLAASLKDFLPKDGTKGEILQYGSNPEMQKISAKLQSAAQKDPVFFQNHMKSVGPGKPLVYDKRLGITEAELQKLISSGPESFTLVKVGDGVFNQTKEGFSVKGPDSNTSFKTSVSNSGILAGEFPKPYSAPEEFDNPKEPSGGLRGLSFKVEEAKNTTPGAIEGYTSNLVVGRFYDKKNCVIYLDTKKVMKGAMVMRKDFMFRYPCPS